LGNKVEYEFRAFEIRRLIYKVVTYLKGIKPGKVRALSLAQITSSF